MKKRRSVIIALLLVAALALGIGYAALTQNLTLNGSANVIVDSSKFSVVYTGVTYDIGDYSADKINATAAGASATFKVSDLDVVGEEMTFVYKIQNTSTAHYDATLAAFTTDVDTLVRDSDGTALDREEYYDIDITITLDDDSDGSGRLHYEDTATMTVVVKCVKSPVEDVTLTYNGHITATAVEVQ